MWSVEGPQNKNKKLYIYLKKKKEKKKGFPNILRWGRGLPQWMMHRRFFEAIKQDMLLMFERDGVYDRGGQAVQVTK